MTKDEIKFFKRFLKERGIYATFFREIKRFPSRRRNLPVNTFFEEHPYPSSVIDELLYWSGTNQGYNFWSFENRIYNNSYQKYKKYGIKFFYKG